MRATAIAQQEAPSAAMAIRVSNRRINSSSTNTAPAIGALNAVARPAPPHAASSRRDRLASGEISAPQENLYLRPFVHLDLRGPGPDRPRSPAIHQRTSPAGD